MVNECQLNQYKFNCQWNFIDLTEVMMTCKNVLCTVKVWRNAIEKEHKYSVSVAVKYKFSKWYWSIVMKYNYSSSLLLSLQPHSNIDCITFLEEWKILKGWINAYI